MYSLVLSSRCSHALTIGGFFCGGQDVAHFRHHGSSGSSEGFTELDTGSDADQAWGEGEKGHIESDVVGGTRLEEARQHLSSDTRTFVNLLISFVGAGILGIPFAFRKVRREGGTSL